MLLLLPWRSLLLCVQSPAPKPTPTRARTYHTHNTHPHALTHPHAHAQLGPPQRVCGGPGLERAARGAAGERGLGSERGGVAHVGDGGAVRCSLLCVFACSCSRVRSRSLLSCCLLHLLLNAGGVWLVCLHALTLPLPNLCLQCYQRR